MIKEKEKISISFLKICVVKRKALGTNYFSLLKIGAES